MIQREKILAQLQVKRTQFTTFDSNFHTEASKYAEAIKAMQSLSAEDLLARLQAEPAPGAFPTSEFEIARNLCRKYGFSFSNHQESRAWACEVLEGHTTFAVDGSQIATDARFNIPIAAVQAAWFENHHTHDGKYEKDTVFEILSPDELLVEFNGERQISEQMVNLRRFELETATICRLMKRLAANRNGSTKLPLALFDSSLVISFADRLQEPMRKRHVQAIVGLLECSQETGIPIVGYVDASDARDLTRMLERCFMLPRAERVHDAEIVHSQLTWGDRTPAFQCARRGADQRNESILESIENAGHKIGFVYLKSAGAAPPARLDFPMWVLEKGLLDEVVDLVRAEIIVGNGYPYALEAADAATVITTPDRQAFFAIFQRFLESQGLTLRMTQKAASKTRRR